MGLPSNLFSTPPCIVEQHILSKKNRPLYYNKNEIVYSNGSGDMFESLSVHFHTTLRRTTITARIKFLRILHKPTRAHTNRLSPILVIELFWKKLIRINTFSLDALAGFIPRTSLILDYCISQQSQLNDSSRS